jgi:co-chaperonin GroES (HSP10)
MTTMDLPLELPPGIEQIAEPDEGATNAQKASALPKPAGFKLLCVAPDIKETFEDSLLVKSRKTMQDDEAATTVLFVLEVGPDAYNDRTRFPSGPWCRKGDFIIVRTYAGTRFKVFGKEFRVISDDQVEATVADPRGLSRVY